MTPYERKVIETAKNLVREWTAYHHAVEEGFIKDSVEGTIEQELIKNELTHAALEAKLAFFCAVSTLIKVNRSAECDF